MGVIGHGRTVVLASPPHSPVGEGVYRILRHGDHTHLVYPLELPEEPGPAQVHRLLYKIPSHLHGLPEGFQHQAHPDRPAQALQGTNDLGNVGYDAPLGTVGRTFRFRFRLFALDEPLDVPAGVTRDKLFQATSGHVLDEAELICTHERAPVE